MGNETPQRKYATVKNQLIQAIIGEHFRFASVTQAKIKLQSLEGQFTHSSQRPTDIAEDAVFLWIKDFDVTPQEKSQGCKGNFAAVHYRPARSASGGKEQKYTLYAMKIPVEAKRHPQQQRKKTSHPNWGHPILRMIQKGKIYPVYEDAARDLQLLHEEYPTTTIPLGNKLNLIVYSKIYENSIQKFMLEIAVHEGGGFFIKVVERKATPKTTLKQPEAEPQGKFAAMVTLKRKRKKKPS